MSVKDTFYPSSLQEALSLKKRHGDEAMFMAGGIDILFNMRHHAISPGYLINLKSVPNLSYISHDGQDGLKIGTLTTIRDIEVSPLVRQKLGMLSQAASKLASYQVRNVATLGGNVLQSVKCVYYNLSHVTEFMRRSLPPCPQRGGAVCTALRKDSLYHSLLGKAVKRCIAPPSSDMVPPLVALSAVIRVTGPAGERIIPFEHFIRGAGETALEADEVLREVRIPDATPNRGGCYLKYTRNPIDFPAVGVAVTLTLESDGRSCRDTRIVLGGLSPTPYRVGGAENRLNGREFSDEVLDDAVDAALKGARSYGPATTFKARKAESMLKDALRCAYEDAKGRLRHAHSQMRASGC